MRKWSRYRKSDGVFTGNVIAARLYEEIAANENDDFGLIEGEFDPLSQCVDLQFKVVVDFVPPAPDEFHEWNQQTKRWELTQQRQRALADDFSARSLLADLDRKLLRALIEDKLGIKPTKADRDAGAMTVDEIQAAQQAARAKLLKP